MVLMELPVGAKEEKRAVATDNVINLMTKAHAIRCPDMFLFLFYFS